MYNEMRISSLARCNNNFSFLPKFMVKIIGNGLIAKKFSSVDLPEECVILASGVSNSQEVRKEEFLREIRLVSNAIHNCRESTLVYFSTCSISQKIKTPYIRHKLLIENLIQEESNSYHIFRLPQVVGCTDNLTLVSYLTCSIFQGAVVNIQKYATRNLLDVDDLVRLASYVVKNRIMKNSVQNFASGESVPVIDIFYEVARILNLNPKFSIVDSGESYDIDINFLKSTFGLSDNVFLSSYWRTVLLKYVPLILKLNNGVLIDE